MPPTALTGTVRSDIAHIDRIIGVGEVTISDHRSSQPTVDELLRLASEAHVGSMMSGKAGVLHMHVGDDERGLQLIRDVLAMSKIPARVLNPTYVNRRRALFDEAVALTTRGCTIDIAAFPVDDGDDAWSAPDALEQYWDAVSPRERVTVSSDGGGRLPKFDGDGVMITMDVGSSASRSETLVRCCSESMRWSRCCRPLPEMSQHYCD